MSLSQTLALAGAYIRALDENERLKLISDEQAANFLNWHDRSKLEAIIRNHKACYREA